MAAGSPRSCAAADGYEVGGRASAAGATGHVWVAPTDDTAVPASGTPVPAPR